MHKNADLIKGTLRTQGGTLICSYIRRLGSFFWVQSIEFQYFLWFSEKIIFLGYEDFMDMFLGHHKIRLHLGVISMHFRVFSQGQGTEWGIVFGLLKFQIFSWGA